MYQSGRAGDEAKKCKSPAKSGRVGITAIHPGKNANDLGPVGQSIAGNHHIHGQKENCLKLFRSRRQSPEKLNNPKRLFSCIEELYFSKEVKENALASEGKSCRP